MEEKPKTNFLVACDVAESYLPKYRQGTLKLESRTIIQAHLAVCDRCWDKLSMQICGKEEYQEMIAS